jgi:hypothetical protein
MTRIVSSRTVPVDAAAAADVFLDWTKDPQWRTAVQRMSAEPGGPAQIGQQLVEELRFAGTTFVTPTTIIASGPHRASYAGGSASVAASGSREVRAEPDGTVTLVASLDVSLRGALRPLTSLLAPMYRRMQERDLDRLAALLVA